MIPMRSSTIFKSRWMALIWASGIIWFAYDVAASRPEGDTHFANEVQMKDSSGTPVTDDDANRLAEALNGF